MLDPGEIPPGLPCTAGTGVGADAFFPHPPTPLEPVPGPPYQGVPPPEPPFKPLLSVFGVGDWAPPPPPPPEAVKVAGIVGPAIVLSPPIIPTVRCAGAGLPKRPPPLPPPPIITV